MFMNEHFDPNDRDDFFSDYDTDEPDED